MYYNVSARRVGEPTAFHDEDVSGDQALQAAISAIQAMSNANQEPYHLSIKPREHLMMITPVSLESVKPVKEEISAMPYQPPKTDDSPSVCEILNRGD